MATYYVDLENGNDANAGNTYAARWKTLTNGATASRLAPGDIIRVMSSLDPINIGSGSWTDKGLFVTLSNSNLTKSINFGNNWASPSGYVTCSAPATPRKQGITSTQLAIASGFTTGKVAYGLITNNGPQSFSSYNSVTTWIRVSAPVAAGVFSLRLCSDVSGNTTVNSLSIPAISIINTWIPILVPAGSVLGNSISSVALYALTDPGVVTINFDNILACNSNSLNLTSLIGKSNTGAESFWSVQSISGSTIYIDGGLEETPETTRGYSGTTESVTTYIVNPIVLSTDVGTINASGTLNLPINISGGWSRTDMSVQNGLTCIRQVNQSVTGFTLSSKNDINISNIIHVGGGTGINCTSCTRVSLSNIQIISSSALGVSTIGDVSLNNIFISGTTGNSLVLYSGAYVNTVVIKSSISNGVICSDSELYTITVSNCGASGLSILQGNICRDIISKDNVQYGIVIGKFGNSKIYNLTTSGNTLAGIQYDAAKTSGYNFIRNTSVAESTKVSTSFPAGSTSFSGGLRIEKYEGVITDIRHWVFGGLIVSDAGADRHTASGIAWKISPTSALRISSTPIILPLTRVAVNANALVTVKAWMKRSNTGLTGKLVCKKSQIAGVANEVSASVTAIADTYEELTITFIPTETGVVEIEAQAYGGTTYSLFIDDMTITQA